MKEKIQLITYNEKILSNYEDISTVNNFNTAKSLDNYDINVIDMSNQDLWITNASNVTSRIKKISDIHSLKTMISNSNKTSILVILPQNIIYKTSNGTGATYELKNIIQTLEEVISLTVPINSLNLIYENNTNSILGQQYNSSFTFLNDEDRSIFKSDISNKVTAIKNNNLYLTTISVINSDNPSGLIDLLKQLELIKTTEDIPEWVYKYNFNDDNIQNELITKAKEIIKKEKEKIEECNTILTNNLYYKQILYVNGEDLVKIVFQILEKILDTSLKDFIDKKSEDFLIKKANVTFVGEIKGVTSNVKNEHISQLLVHTAKYYDKLQENNIEENVKSLLIINYERTKEVSKRNPIHEYQVELAVKNNTLIIDTITLLSLFENYLNEKNSIENVIEILSKKSGVLLFEESKFKKDE